MKKTMFRLWCVWGLIHVDSYKTVIYLRSERRLLEAQIIPDESTQGNLMSSEMFFFLLKALEIMVTFFFGINKLSKINLSSFPSPSSIIYRYNSKAANLPVYCFGILTLIYSLNYLLATPGNRSKISMTIWNHLKLLLVRCYMFHSEQIIINHQDVKHFSLNNFPSTAWGAICLMLFAFKVGIHYEAALVYW